MPLRDYHCEKCGYEFEEMTSKVLRACPSCKKKSLAVVFNKVATYVSRYSPMHPRLSRGRG